MADHRSAANARRHAGQGSAQSTGQEAGGYGIPVQTDEAAEPNSPLELSPPDWKESLRRTMREMKADRGPLIAAGMAFYWFLAVFPAVLAGVGILGLVHAGPDVSNSISNAVRRALPGDAARVLTDSITQATGRPSGGSAVAAIIGLAVALWSASTGFVALQAGLDVAYDVGEERKFARKRLVAFELIVVAAVMGGVATALIVFGQPLGEGLRQHLPFGGAFVLVWTALRWVLGLGALSLLFAGFYYLGPNRASPKWTWVSAGGLVATGIWLAASIGFSFYVSSFGSYAKTYGSLTGVVVLMLWLYLSALAVVLGGELNAELERQAEIRRRGGDPEVQQHRRQGSSREPDESQWLDSMKRLRGKGASERRP